MTIDKDDTDALDALFDAARSRPVAPEPAFLRRLHEDADDSVTRPAAPRPTVRFSRTGIGRRLSALLPASGLAATTAVGVWIGVNLSETGLAEDWLAPDSSGSLEVSAFLPGASFATLDLGDDQP